MINLDRAISAFVNRPAEMSPSFDRFVIFLTNSDLVKGGFVMAVLWAAWFFLSGDQLRNRSILLTSIAGSLLALFLARVLAYAAPLRLRPVLDPAMHFRPPTGLPPQSNWTTWSSFPSDHTALFFALAWGVWRVSRRTGALLFSYVLIAIALPRLYTGIHFFSDLLAGALLGIGCAAILELRWIRQYIALPILRCGERHPGIFYFLLSLLTFQIATLFWDIRTAMSLMGFSS